MSSGDLHHPDAPPPPAPAPEPKKSFFVLQSESFEWLSASTRITGMFITLDFAEAEAMRLKAKHPSLHFGVARLISEAREVKHPVEIVRVFPTDDVP